MASKVTGYQQVLEDFDATCDWFAEKLKRPVHDSRLGLIRSAIAEVVATTGLPREQRREHSPSDFLRAYHAMSDAFGFTSIARSFAALPDHRLPRRLLGKAIKGALSPEDESTDNSGARNYFAQLELAASLLDHGVEVTGFGDVEFDFEGTRFVVECKRPWVEARVKPLVSEAASQIARALDGIHDRPARGLVALAIDHIAGIDRMLPTELPVSNESDARLRSRETAMAFLEHFGDPIAGEDDRVIGLLIIPRMIVHTVPSNSFGLSYIPALAIPSWLSPEDRARMDSLVGLLRGKG